MKQRNFRPLLPLLGAMTVGGLGLQSASALTPVNLTSDDVDLLGSSLATFDAVNGVYVLNGDQTLDASKNYILTDKLFVTAGNTLTIPAGTKIYSTFDDKGDADKTNDEFGSIVVTRGSNIEATGTAAQPIVMTTIWELEAIRGTDIDGDALVRTAPTKADRGLWGGLVILGNANTYNYSAPGVRIGENAVEGFAPTVSPDGDSDGRADIVEYGGNDDADDSGTLQYVSIRHGGYEWATDEEINGLTLGAVGSGTTIDHVEVLSNSDDGIEFFGGTVDVTHALISFVKDDGLDIDEGYTGRIQFVCVIQTPTDTDSLGATIQDSDHGGEWDGNVGGDSSDFVSAPKIANLTLIGDNEGDHGIKLDDFFAGSVYNSAVTNFADLVTVTGDGVLFATASINNVSTDVSNVLEGTNDSVEGFVASQFTTVADVQLNQVNAVAGTYDPRPAAGSPLLGATVTDVNAIDPFFVNTSYQGAFDQSTNWALGWTGTAALGHFVDASGSSLVNLTADDIDIISASSIATFDAVNGVYVLNGDQTLDASKNYILTERLFVTNGNTLTIPAGTTIYSTFDDKGDADKSNDAFGAIVVTRGSNIEATGTAAQPIVMTTIWELEAARGNDIDGDTVTAPAPTKADRGLWGGLVILGNANTYNYSAPGVRIGENVIEGFSPTVSPDGDLDGRADIVEYGGNDDADDSGTIQYVSIRHGGYEFATDEEINGLTLGAVGSGTTIDHVEVLSNSDDGIEFFGGTVDVTHALISFVKDDGLDIDEGYTGRIQFVCVIQTPTDTDSLGATIQDSDHGGEWDGNVGGNSSDFVSAPQIANLTLIGDNEGDHAIKLDDFFAGSVYNSAVTNFVDLVTVTGDGVLFATASINNVSTDVANALEGTNDTVEGFVAGQFTTVADVQLNEVNAAAGTYDPRPAAGSPLLGATVTDVNAIDPFFVNTSYQGAFDQSTNWALGWTGTDALGHFSGGGSDFDSWASANGVVGGPNGDDDNDGLTNDYERLFALNATSAASVNPIVTPLDASAGTFSYTRRDTALTGVGYEIWTSTDLQTWTQDLGAAQTPNLVGEVETVAVTLTATPVNGKLFVQIRTN